MQIEFGYFAHAIDGRFVTFAVPTFRTDRYSKQLREGPIHFDAMPIIKAKSEKLGRALRIVDVGANVGTVSLPLAAAGHTVLAIEAEAVNFGTLVAATARNKFRSLTPVHAAAFSHFSLVHISGDSAWAQISKVGAPVFGLPLVDLIEAFGFMDCDFIKIDIEGAELEALHDIERLIAANDHVEFIYESNTPASIEFGHRAQDLIARFENLGFENLLLDRARLMITDSSRPQGNPVADLLATKNAADINCFPVIPFDFASVELDVRKAANRKLLPHVRHALAQEDFFPDDWRDGEAWKNAKIAAQSTMSAQTERSIR